MQDKANEFGFEITPDMLRAGTDIINEWVSDNWGRLEEHAHGDIRSLLERLAPLYNTYCNRAS